MQVLKTFTFPSPEDLIYSLISNKTLNFVKSFKFTSENVPFQQGLFI